MTLDDLERQNRGFYGFFSRYEAAQVFIIHKEAPPSPTPHAIRPMCIMVPMGRVQVICNFRNYNYWTGNAIGFRASRELCSNFLSCLVTIVCDQIYTQPIRRIGLVVDDSFKYDRVDYCGEGWPCLPNTVLHYFIDMLLKIKIVFCRVKC